MSNYNVNDNRNQPLEKGGVYLNPNITTFMIFTGEYDTEGNPFFELDRTPRLLMRKEEVKGYIFIGDLKHSRDLKQYGIHVNDQLRCVLSKLEKEVAKQPRDSRNMMGKYSDPASGSYKSHGL